MGKKMILKVVTGVLLLYTFGGFFGVPYIIEKVAPQKVTEATDGGIFSVKSASFNPFLFKLDIQNLSFKTPQNGEFVTLKGLSINLNPLDYLWKQALVIEDLRIDEPRVVIAKDHEGVMNFGWLLKEDNATQEESKPLSLMINHFTLAHGDVEYADVSEGKKYHEKIDDFGFHFENIDLRDMSASHGSTRLYATINDGGFIDLRGKIDSLKPFAIHGKVAFDSGKLYTPWRYVEGKMPIEVADGEMDVEFEYTLNSDDLNATKLSNLHAGLKNLRIIPKGGKDTLFSLGMLEVAEASVWPIRKRFETQNIRLHGMELAASRGTDGSIDWVNYIDEINKAFPDDENESDKTPWSFRIEKFSLDSLGVQWRDNAPKSPYRLRVDTIALHTGAIDSDEREAIAAEITSGAMSMNRIGDGSMIGSFESFGVENALIDRAGKRAIVSALSLRKPSVEFKRLKDGKIDFTEQYLYPSKSEASSSTPWSYKIDQMSLEEGNIEFIDEVPERNVAIALDGFNLLVGDFTSNPREKNTITLTTRINKQGSLKIQGDVTREALSSQGRFELKGIDVSKFDPYIEPSTYASIKRGTLSVGGEYRYGGEKARVNGRLGLTDWVVNDSRDQSVLVGWANIGVTPFVYAYPDNRLKINQLDMNGLYANAVIDANKTLNFSTLSKSANESNVTEHSTSNPFGVDIIKFVIKDGSANFSDLSLPLLFKTYIHDLSGQILGISTTKDVVTYVKLSGGVDEYGMAQVNGKLNTKAPKDFADVAVNFDNLDLKQYTPYSLEFLGYKIAGGKLYLNLGYVIDKGKLNSKNQIIIKQIELGEEKAGGSPWPLRLVVALLEDSDGVIDIDLPIEGDVNAPDFKYGKLVWQVIGNILTKAITSPFRLLGSLMGMDSDDDSLSSVAFEPGEATLLPPQREKLDKLSAMLLKRPKLTLKIHGGWESVEDDRALRIQKLIASVMGNKGAKTSSEAMSIEYLESTANKTLDSSELKELRASMREKHPEESAYVQHYSAALVEKLIVHQVIASPELEALATQRAQMILNYLHKNPAVSTRVTVVGNEKSSLDVKKLVESRLELTVQ